jgi:ParB/RepB/Spo0J family partition protein
VSATLLQLHPGTLIHSPQVRTNVGQDESFASLIESVRTLGVLQPILARKVGKEYHVLAGHRRTLAALAAELPTVPVYVSATPDEEVTARQLVENLHREGLSLKDTAAGVRALYDEHHSARLVADMLGKSAPWVSKMLSLTAEAGGRITQSLIAQDAIPDLECAYLLSIIERRTDVKTTQDTVKWMRESADPRAFLRGRIKQLDAEQKPPTDTPAPAVGKSATATDNIALYLTKPEALMLKQYLDGPAPAADPHGIAIHLRAIIAAAIEKAGK